MNGFYGAGACGLISVFASFFAWLGLAPKWQVELEAFSHAFLVVGYFVLALTLVVVWT